VYVIKLLFQIKKNIYLFPIIFRDFENLEQDEEQEIVPEEPEIRISREEIISRYQVCSFQFQNNISFFFILKVCRNRT
jgi:hypothetical protein